MASLLSVYHDEENHRVFSKTSLHSIYLVSCLKKKLYMSACRNDLYSLDAPMIIALEISRPYFVCGVAPHVGNLIKSVH